MLKIEILAGGQQRNSAYDDLITDYIRRIKWHMHIIDINAPTSKKHTAEQIKHAELSLFSKHIDDKAYKIALDEHGKNIDSLSFTNTLKKINEEMGYQKIQFLIGGAYGLHGDILKNMDLKLCFGTLTWPHIMVRLMLSEQIYRAQQIQIGHPYHKE